MTAAPITRRETTGVKMTGGVSEAIRQQTAHMQRRAVWALLAVALVWALEFFGVQAMSFSFDYPAPMSKWIGAQAVRFSLDAAFCLGCVFLLPRGFTVAGFTIFLLFAQVAGYYKAVFGRALTLTTIQAQWAEGLIGARFDWVYVNKLLLLAMLAALAFKIWLLTRARLENLSRRTRCGVGSAAWAGYFLLAVLAMGWIDPARKLRTFGTGDRLGMTYGFALLWVGETVYLNQSQLLQEAVAQRAQVSDRLTAIEPPLTLTGDVVLIQVESLDWRVLNHCVNGKPVTPFLNHLADEAMLFKISACHKNGSCDADFVMLNAVPPSPTVMTYALTRYPYGDTLPQAAERDGYKTAAFHGNSGRFFSREHAFKRMGFDDLWFLEEMRDVCKLPVSLWGIRDDEVFAFSQSLLRERSAAGLHRLHYIITLTSHQPFIYLEASECTFLPKADGMLDRYFNGINFVDRHLASYIGNLAQGTLVVIFGDHRAMVDYGAAAASDDRAEHVPLFIHRVGEKLAARQNSRTLPLAYSGELTMLDAATYIRRFFEKKGGKAKGL